MLPTNCTLTCARTNTAHSAFVEPARPEIRGLLGLPATKVFEAYIDGLVDISEQDKLTSGSDEVYQVIACEKFDVAIGAHTHLALEGKWGT